MKRQRLRKIILLIAFVLFPLFKPFLSPVTVVMGVLQGVITGGLAIYITLFLSSLFFGRLYCGWICPAGGLQEYCALIVNKKPVGGKWNLIKYFPWGTLVTVIIIVAVTAGGFRKIDFMFQKSINIPPLTEYIVYYSCIALIIVLALSFGRRAECHYACWLAPFMVAGSRAGQLLRLPSLHLAVSKTNCSSCKLCNKNCAMGLEVCQMVQNGSINSSECILCGECVDICPNKAIKYSWGFRSGIHKDNNISTNHNTKKEDPVI